MNKIYNYVKKMLFIMAAVITLTSLTVPARSYAAEAAVTEGKVEIVSAMSGNRLIDTKKSQKYENGASLRICPGSSQRMMLPGAERIASVKTSMFPDSLKNCLQFL